MMKIRIALVTALLVLLPALPVRAQAPITVVFRLTLVGSVGPEAGFSVLSFAGASSTATEAVFCGQALMPGHPAGARCGGQSAVFTQRVGITVGTRLHFDVVRSHPTYALVLSGTFTPYTDATVAATYPHAASAVPVTFQLTFTSQPAAVVQSAGGGLYFAVTYPYVPRRGRERRSGGIDPRALYADLPLCTSSAKPEDGAYAGRCREGGTYAAIIFVPPGTIGRYVFEAFWWGKPPCVTSSLGIVRVARSAIRVPMRVTAGGGHCFPPGIFGGAGLQFT